MSAPDFAAEGLLDGLSGEARVEREELLSALHEDGVSIEDLRNASRDGTLVFLGADREVQGAARYTRREIAEMTGMDMELGAKLMRAQGIAVPEPDERVLGEVELELARIAVIYRDLGVTAEEQIAVNRALAAGLARAADAMREVAVRVSLEPGATERDLAASFAANVHELMPLVDPLLSAMMRQQLRSVVRNEAVNAAEREDGNLAGAREISVCFADLVGFTRVGEEVPPDELGRIAIGLEELALDVAVQPVRLVKSLGDGVMLVSPEPAPLVSFALELVERIDMIDTGMPQLRVGLASGPALHRATDWFGRPVNLASRLSAVARPGSVLATKELHRTLEGAPAFNWSFAGSRRLKGIREPVQLWRVRRANPA